MTDSLKTFASQEEEEKIIDQLKFILERGFREFKKLYELNKDCIHDVKQKLPDYLNNVFEETKKVFLERFIKALDSSLLPKALPTLELLEQYLELFNEYEEEFENQEDPIYFRTIRSNIEIAKADILAAAG